MDQERGDVRVLVADHDPDAADSLAIFLQHAGYATKSTIHGGEALEIIADWRPQIAIIELEVPFYSGIEIASRVRAGAYRDVLLIATTSWPFPDKKSRAISAGFDDFLLKPADPKLVLETVAAGIHSRRFKPPPNSGKHLDAGENPA